MDISIVIKRLRDISAEAAVGSADRAKLAELLSTLADQFEAERDMEEGIVFDYMNS